MKPSRRCASSAPRWAVSFRVSRSRLGGPDWASAAARARMAVSSSLNCCAMAPVSRPIVSIFSACFNARSRASCAAASSGVIGPFNRPAGRRRQAECASIRASRSPRNPMAPRPYILNELTWKTVRDTRYEVAVLPWGATEAHNFHLPYSTVNVETERIAALAAGRAWERGARVVVLPLVPFGVATARAGQVIPKLVILNGHGGNDFRQMIRELQPGVALFLRTVNWYQVVDAKAFFADLGDHAGELETSVMLQVAPELVRPLSEAGPGRARRFKVAGLREGWAWAPRQWRQVTDDTGVGDPAKATAEKGRSYVEAVSEKIAGFLVELARADTAQMYE